MKGNNTTHKELLTFTNLTNLDWHFVDNKTETQDALGKKKIEFKKLNDLLKPELFVREETDPDTGDKRTIPVYGEGEEGIIKLRQKAGIAMEYLEKWQEYDYTEGKRGIDEGSFLQDWEVIYAADNYKVIADHLDYIYGEIKKRGVVLVDKDGEELELYPKLETVK